MNQRRTFLKVLGASAVVAACGGDDGESAETSTSATSGSGSGGQGGGSTSSTSSNGGATGEGGAGTQSSSTSGQGGGQPNGLPPNFVAVGNVSDVMDGLLKSVPTSSLLLGRDAGGLYAMSSLCTHKFCDMCKQGAINASGVVCNCHKSKFDNNGAVTQGPAVKPLDHFDCVVLDDGTIGVDKSAIVAADFRAAIP